MFEEFGGDVFVGRIFVGQFQRHGQHGGAVHPHPGGAVGLFQEDAVAAADCERSKTPMLSEAQESAGENVLALDVLAVDPPIEIEQLLVKHAGQEVAGRVRRGPPAIL